MITKVTNSKEMREALNENLHGLLTGRRKPNIVKEANNTLGKIISDVKMELMQNAMAGIRGQIEWFNHKPVRKKRIARRAKSKIK